ncbi:MAG TPA: hypothetical protein VMZ52_03475 [Bryobacteraceae bacterium]|nr:hypothetical protein [Bryobacteraceae bacterium]
MEDSKTNTGSKDPLDIRSLVRGAIQEFIHLEQSKAEPAYKVELMEERKRRESLEHRVNELVEENRRTRVLAEEAERGSAIRTELQRLGVVKVDLAYKAVKDEIHRGEDGRLIATNGASEVAMKDFLSEFVNQNPELLPARISGGSGAGPAHKPAMSSGGIDLEKIKPGMSAEDMERVRQEISRIASQTLRSL